MKMLRQRRFQILGLSATILVVLAVTVCVLICLLVSWYAYRVYKGIEAFANHDPKKAAITQTRQYVEASYIHSQKPTPAENPVSPGYEWPYRCWELLHEPAVESSNQYTLRVTYYNWEDGGSFGASGADEITVLVEFANGSQVISYYRAGTVRFCNPPDELNDDNK